MTSQKEELAPKTVKNSFFNIGAFVWPLLMAFFATPFIVHSLGNENYGILALVISFIGFLGFLDFGIAPALVKYTAQYHATNELNKLSRFFSSALYFYLLIGIFAAVVISLFTHFLAPQLIKVAPANIPTLKFVLYIAAIGFFVNMILTAFSAIPGALQRFDVASYVNLFITTLSTALTVLLVALGKGVVSLAFLAVCSSLLAIAIYVRINSRLIPQLRFIPKLDREAARKMFSFGTYAVITSIATVALFQLDKLILASQLGAAAVTYYVVPGNLTVKIHGLVAAMTTVVFPLSSALLATNNTHKLGALYERATRVILIFLVIAITPIYLLANKFLYYWIGSDFATNSTVVMQLLVGTYSVLALTAIPFYILYGAGRPKLATFNAVLCAVINITLLFVLIPRLGINGAALAYLIAVIPGALIFLYFVERRILGFNSWRFYSRLLPKLLVVAGISLGSAWFLSRSVTSLSSFVGFYVLIVLFTVIIAILVKIIPEKDMSLIKSLLKKVFPKRPKNIKPR